MTNDQINKLADFMYSSNSSNDVPFRLSLSCGMAGDDIDKEEFIKLMQFLSRTNCTKAEFSKFLETIYAERRLD